MAKNNAPTPPPYGSGPHPTPEQSETLAESLNDQWETSRDRGTNPPAPDTDDMRGGNVKL